MAPDRLAPHLAALAAEQGRSAGAARRNGRIPPRCPYRADGQSLTQARMAAAWADAFLQSAGEPAPLPD